MDTSVFLKYLEKAIELNWSFNNDGIWTMKEK